MIPWFTWEPLVTQLRPGYATLEILGGHQRINLVLSTSWPAASKAQEVDVDVGLYDHGRAPPPRPRRGGGGPWDYTTPGYNSTLQTSA